MRVKVRKAWRAAVIAYIAIPAAVIGIAIAPSASATPSAASLPQTCTFYHGHVGGSFDAIDSYTSRGLAWAEASSKEGTPLSLARYRDTLVLELCLSKKTQLFKNFTPISRFQLVNSPSLCIGLSEPIKAGAVLYQQTCNSSSPGQHWFLNTSP